MNTYITYERDTAAVQRDDVTTDYTDLQLLAAVAAEAGSELAASRNNDDVSFRRSTHLFAYICCLYRYVDVRATGSTNQCTSA